MIQNNIKLLQQDSEVSEEADAFSQCVRLLLWDFVLLAINRHNGVSKKRKKNWK